MYFRINKVDTSIARIKALRQTVRSLFGPSHDLPHQFRFPRLILAQPARMRCCQFQLELPVSSGVRRVAAQMVTEKKMLLPVGTALLDGVQVKATLPPFPLLEINAPSGMRSLIEVESNGTELFVQLFGPRPQSRRHNQINRRFGNQTGDGGASKMFGGGGGRAKRAAQQFIRIPFATRQKLGQLRSLHSTPGTRFSPSRSPRISRCLQHLSIGVRIKLIGCQHQPVWIMWLNLGSLGG
ncbi:hypothetical protein DESA109040_20805 [Deinococcus saxicola]